MSAMTRLGERIDRTINGFQALRAEVDNFDRSLKTIGGGGGSGGSTMGGGVGGGRVGSGGGGGGARLGTVGGERMLPELRAIHGVLLAGFQALLQQQTRAARSNDATTRASR